MPADPTKDTREETAVAVPGVLGVGPARSGRRIVHLGPAAGWMIPAGIFRWERELSLVRRADMTAQLAKALHATLPHEQIAAKRFGKALGAVQASPLLAMSSNLVEAARKEGVRVHTVGVDRVSADFYYFAEGGAGESLRAQGNLVEMLGDRADAAVTNADIEALQASLINRLLSELSKGLVSELEVELADALPRLSRDGTGLAGTDLEAFEAQAKALALGSARFEAAGRRLAEALTSAARQGQTSARVPLYGEAQREAMAPLEVLVIGNSLLLPECFVWTVRGVPREERIDTQPKPAPRPIAAPASAPKIATVRASPSDTATAAATASATASAAMSASASASAPATATASAPEPARAPAPAPAASSDASTSKPDIAAKPKPSQTAAQPPKDAGAPRAAAPARSAVAAKRSPWVPILLFLGLIASLYFLWRNMP
jgi:hypothetical protein